MLCAVSSFGRHAANIDPGYGPDICANHARVKVPNRRSRGLVNPLNATAIFLGRLSGDAAGLKGTDDGTPHQA
jgi:hypothetical protein